VPFPSESAEESQDRPVPRILVVLAPKDTDHQDWAKVLLLAA